MVKIFEGALSNRTEFSKFSLFPAKNPQIILMKSKEKAFNCTITTIPRLKVDM